jgi:tripartite-type tricarboxylate transporter receptor subunit TctC
LPYVSGGQFKALGIASRRRFALLPALPTLVVSGLPELEVEAWFGLFGPALMPPSAAIWFTEQVAAHLSDDGRRMQLLALGLEPAAGTRLQYATRIHTETERWGPILRASRMPLRDQS